MVRPLTEAQQDRIRAKIAEIARDIDYLVTNGGKGLVYGGTALHDTAFQRRRAELLQQVLDTNDVDQVLLRASKVLQQADTEERRLEAALLLWAVEEVGSP